MPSRLVPEASERRVVVLVAAVGLRVLLLVPRVTPSVSGCNVEAVEDRVKAVSYALGRHEDK